MEKQLLSKLGDEANKITNVFNERLEKLEILKSIYEFIGKNASDEKLYYDEIDGFVRMISNSLSLNVSLGIFELANQYKNEDEVDKAIREYEHLGNNWCKLSNMLNNSI